MGDPLKDLRDLVIKESQLDEGTIIAINDDGTFRVSTKLGISDATGNVNLFKVGDTVKVEDGIITFQKSVEDNLIVHEL